MFTLLGGLFLGWALGANDASNVFGTAVGAKIIPFRRAAIICAIAVVAGAALQGEAGIDTLSGLTAQTPTTITIVTVSAAVTVTIMTALGLPISTSQAIVGAISAIGLATRNLHYPGLIKVVVSWVSAPIGAMLFALIISYVVRAFFCKIRMGILTRDKILWGGLLAVGTYGSYALGANNVANATGVYSGLIPGVSDFLLAVIGGGAIAVGVLTFSRRVMTSVGTKLMKLDAFNAFVAVTSMSVTVHIFSAVGVPVSLSQAIVGAIIGIGLTQNVKNVRFNMLKIFGTGWVLTPFVAFVLSAAGYALFAE